MIVEIVCIAQSLSNVSGITMEEGDSRRAWENALRLFY